MLLRDPILSSSVQRFVALSAFSLTVAGFSARSLLSQSTGVHLRIGLIVPAGASERALSVARGVRLGAAESRQTAALFAGGVELYEADGSGAAGADAAANQLLSRRKVQIIIAAADEDVDALSHFAASHSLVFFNAASRRASLRLACRRTTFHVEASNVAYQNASALARAGGPANSNGARQNLRDAADSVALWSPALERFGASQINARYRTMFNADMDGGAWAGWIAVKTAAEAALRVRSTDPRKLVAYLEASSTQFDGHKGWPLTYRLADHQLRQPLYIVAAAGDSRTGRARPIQDVPDISQLSAGMQSPAAALDRLNARPGIRACSWLPL